MKPKSPYTAIVLVLFLFINIQQNKVHAKDLNHNKYLQTALSALSDSPALAASMADTILHQATLNNDKLGFAHYHYLKANIAESKLNFNEAKQLFTKALSEYEALHDSINVTLTCLRLSETFFKVANYDKSEYYINKGFWYISKKQKKLAETLNIRKIKLFVETMQPQKAVNAAERPLIIEAAELVNNPYAKLYLGKAHSMLQNYQSALVYFTEAAFEFTKANNDEGLADIYLTFGNNFYYWKNYKTALEYYYKALEYIKYSSNVKFKLELYLKIGEVYIKQGDSELAKKYVVNGLSLSEEYNYMPGIAMGNLLLGDISVKAGEFRKGSVEYQKACSIYSNFNENYPTFKCKLREAQLYYLINQENRFKAQMEYLLRNQDAIKQAHDRLRFFILAERYFKITNDFDNYVKYDTFHEQLLEEKFSSLPYADLVDTHLKFQSIGTLRQLKEKQNELTEIRAEVKTQQWIIILLITSTAVILVFMLIIFRFYRENKQTTRELLQKNIEINKSHEDLLAAKEKAEESDRLKSSFLANMSHEIRTPMNSIIGFSNLLGREDLPLDKRHKYLNIVENNGRNLVNLIDDIIDLSKLESNQLELRKETCYIDDELKHLYRFYQKENLRENKEQIKLRVVLPQKNRLRSIVTDGIRLKQILSNLLSNALKFTDKGAVEFGYTIEKEFVKFYVQDTGIGIAEESENFIFKRFRQVDENMNREYGGAGLGLTLSKGLVELFNGEIWFESEVNKGTVFYFTIRIEQASYFTETELLQGTNAVNQGQNAYYWPNKKVLIAEDENENYLLLEEILDEVKVQIIRARNGVEAVNICKEYDDIDLVLMDIKMPVMDGFDATVNIRELNTSIPIIAQTAFALSDEQKKCMNAGCNDYISKPIQPHELFEIMACYFNA